MDLTGYWWGPGRLRIEVGGSSESSHSRDSFSFFLNNSWVDSSSDKQLWIHPPIYSSMNWNILIHVTIHEKKWTQSDNSGSWNQRYSRGFQSFFTYFCRFLTDFGDFWQIFAYFPTFPPEKASKYLQVTKLEIPFKVWKIWGMKFEIPFKVWKIRVMKFEIPFKVWKIRGMKFEIPFEVWKIRGMKKIAIRRPLVSWCAHAHSSLSWRQYGQNDPR